MTTRIGDSRHNGSGVCAYWNAGQKTVSIYGWHDGNFISGDRVYGLRQFLSGLGITLEDCKLALHEEDNDGR